MPTDVEYERKFVDVIDLDDEWLIQSDDGWSPISKIMKTVEYEVYILRLHNGLVLNCADKHIVFKSDGSESFVMDLKEFDSITTEFGDSVVVSVERTGVFEHMYDVEVDTESHAYYSNGILSHNTTVVAGFLLWYALFHSSKYIAILANKASQAQEIMDRIRTMYEYMPYFLQQGATVYNKQTVAFENGSKLISAATSNSSIRGRSCSIVYIDECGHIENDFVFYESTYPVITSGKESRVIITSTPRGKRGLFYKLMSEAEAGLNNFKPLTFKWNCVPGRDEAWKEETIRNTSLAQFSQEFEVNFLGSSGTLIPTYILEKLMFLNPIQEDDDIKVYETPDPEKRYVAIADPAGGVEKDYSVCTIFDVTEIPYKVVAKYRNNKISPLQFPTVIVGMATQYNNAPLLVEANNDVGGQVCYIVQYELEYENMVLTRPDPKGLGSKAGVVLRTFPGVKTDRRVKGQGCYNLKAMLENNKLLVNDFEIIEELGTFIAVRDSYEADENCHDDCVMTLVLFCWFVNQDFFKDYSNTNARTSILDSNNSAMLDQLSPFGFMVRPAEESVLVNGISVTVTEGPASALERWFNS